MPEKVSRRKQFNFTKAIACLIAIKKTSKRGYPTDPSIVIKRCNELISILRRDEVLFGQLKESRNDAGDRSELVNSGQAHVKTGNPVRNKSK